MGIALRVLFFALAICCGIVSYFSFRQAALGRPQPSFEQPPPPKEFMGDKGYSIKLLRDNLWEVQMYRSIPADMGTMILGKRNWHDTGITLVHGWNFNMRGTGDGTWEVEAIMENQNIPCGFNPSPNQAKIETPDCRGRMYLRIADDSKSDVLMTVELVPDPVFMGDKEKGGLAAFFAVVCLLIGLAISPKVSGNFYDQLAMMVGRFNPRASFFRRWIEIRKERQEKEWCDAISSKLQSYEGMLIREDSIKQLETNLAYLHKEHYAKHRVIMASLAGLETAHRTAMKDGMTLQFWQTLMLAVATGEMGKAWSEVERTRAMKMIDRQHEAAMRQIAFHYNVKLDKWRKGEELLDDLFALPPMYENDFGDPDYPANTHSGVYLSPNWHKSGEDKKPVDRGELTDKEWEKILNPPMKASRPDEHK